MGRQASEPKDAAVRPDEGTGAAGLRIESGSMTGMKLKVVVHEAEEGGYWAEVPAIPGCATQGENFEELLKNLYEAVEGCLAVEPEPEPADGRIIEIAV